MQKTIIFEDQEMFDEKTERFISIKGQKIQLMHSLVSISKWERKWHKPFLSKLKKYEKTEEEMIDYIRCMTITQNVNPDLYLFITKEQLKEINEYIEDPMTATWFREQKTTSSNEIITAELIYYWMIQLNIPVEFQKWHLNSLLTLIKVCQIKSSDPKKMSTKEIQQSNRELNRQRREMFKSKG